MNKTPSKKKPFWTTSSGAPVADKPKFHHRGPLGPVLMQDFHSPGEARAPERRAASRSAPSTPKKVRLPTGTLTVTTIISKYTGRRRFQGRQEDRGLPALLHRRRRARAPTPSAPRARLCAALYTEERETGTSSATTRRCSSCAIPKFPDSSTPEAPPQDHLRSPTAMWDFWSLSPESLHQSPS